MGALGEGDVAVGPDEFSEGADGPALPMGGVASWLGRHRLSGLSPTAVSPNFTVAWVVIDLKS